MPSVCVLSKWFCRSLGLAVPPRVRFLNKAQKQKDEVTQGISTAADSDSDEELKSFKAHFIKEQSSDSDSQSEEGESDEQEEVEKPRGQLCSADDDEDDDLKDLDLLTVKRKDVFNVSEDSEEEQVNEVRLHLCPLFCYYAGC